MKFISRINTMCSFVYMSFVGYGSLLYGRNRLMGIGLRGIVFNGSKDMMRRRALNVRRVVTRAGNPSHINGGEECHQAAAAARA